MSDVAVLAFQSARRLRATPARHQLSQARFVCERLPVSPHLNEPSLQSNETASDAPARAKRQRWVEHEAPHCAANDGSQILDMPINSVISSRRVAGTDVYNAGGERLGTIDDLMIDRVTGEVLFAVMEFGGFLGVGTDRYPIPWRRLTYDTGLQGYVVPLSIPQLEGAPKYESTKAPVYDDAYAAVLNRYYGV